jgi:hypothetical protein
MRTAILSFAGPVIVAVYLPFCASEIKTVTPSGTAPVSVWRDPAPIETRDLFSGPWGADRAPDPEAVYRLIQRKHTGINPGMTVVDPENREWSVKLAPPDGRPSEAQVEVVVSRILSASGYHQPPVYYLPGFIVEDDFGTRREGGGRFRLKLSSLKDRGDWSWQQNPFVEAPEFNTLLVILMMLNASDIKNSNNTVYEYRAGRAANGGMSCATSAARSAARGDLRRSRATPTPSPAGRCWRRPRARSSSFAITAGTRNWSATGSPAMISLARWRCSNA